MSGDTPVARLLVGQVIVRFGVMRAASASTHDAYPSLPLVDQIAQQIAANIYADATSPD